MLDLDTLLLHEHLQEIFTWVAGHKPARETIVDLGAGTGSGTLGLARTFPNANVVAIDKSQFMLTHLAAAVAEHGFSDRVSSQQIDVDSTWPELAGVDLVWAGSSMHHVGDPTRVLNRIGNMLAPGGLLVVVEMDTLPRYLPDDLGFGVPGLERRLHDAAALAGWNPQQDWAATIRGAGMKITEQRTFGYNTNENPELITRSAQRFLSRARDGLDTALLAEDRATINRLLASSGPQALNKRRDLVLRGSRTAWAAQKHA